MKIWPSRQQWKTWSLPSKLTAVGAVLGALSIVLALLGLLPSSTEVQGWLNVLNPDPYQPTDIPHPPGYLIEHSYQGDCASRPAGFTCVEFSDRYIWLVEDVITSRSDHGVLGTKKIEVAFGSKAYYYHVLGTNYIRTVPFSRP